LQNVEALKNEIIRGIEEKNEIGISLLAKVATAGTSISSAAIGMSAAFIHLSPAFLTTGAILALSSALTGLVNNKSKGEQPIISVFNKLHKL
jgi:hypothetical protein